MHTQCISFSPFYNWAYYATCSVTVGLEYVTEIQVIGQSPRYHCELCDSKFDHNLKFPHLVGSKHRFNVLVSRQVLRASNGNSFSPYIASAHVMGLKAFLFQRHLRVIAEKVHTGPGQPGKYLTLVEAFFQEWKIQENL